MAKDCSNTNCIQNKLDCLVFKIYKFLNTVPKPDDYEKEYDKITEEIFTVLDKTKYATTQTKLKPFSKFLSPERVEILERNFKTKSVENTPKKTTNVEEPKTDVTRKTTVTVIEEQVTIKNFKK